jgi:dipeptidyl aminopeptidase/acylaminoacyl peptidase
MPTAITKKVFNFATMLVMFTALAGAALAQTTVPQSPPAGNQPLALGADRGDAAPQQRRGGQRGGPGSPRVFKSQVTPHWFQNNTRFWYRNDLRGGAKEFILVDAEKGNRQPAFDHEKLAAALSKAADGEFKADRLPFQEIEFVEDGKAIRFDAADKTWKCDLNSYECSQIKEKASASASSLFHGNLLAAHQPLLPRILADQQVGPAGFIEDAEDLDSPQQRGEGQAQAQGQRQGRGRGFGAGEPARPVRSPDAKWTASVKEQNVYLRSEDEGKEYQLSHDGQTNNAYGRLEWAPDSKSLIGWRIEPGERKEVHLVQSSPAGGGRAVLQSRPYPLPGDKFTGYELSVFDAASRKQIKPDVDRTDFGNPRVRWNRDGFHFTYEKVDRGHQRFRIIEVDTHTGAVRNLIDEKTQTFIWTAHTENLTLNLVNYLDRSDEILYVSERDGWRHLYLIDAKAGAIKTQVTKGEWVVRGIDRVDEENRQIWFRASGRNPGQDPYLIHYYRVNFDGTGLVALTEGSGNHAVAYSPDRQFIIDTYSRVDLAPVNELRRVSDGKLVCDLEKTDTSELSASGWKPPEVFVAKARDGQTDIWGIIERPQNFDPNKKYPIIEDIYAGPQGSFVPKTFSPARRYASLTDLGFIVVKMDGMGTANRSKAFHDVCWHNLKDAGFEDRILWIKGAAAKYPYMDTSRVGVYGTSAGGQNAAGAVLFHPEFYKVAVAACGCHDNRMDKSSWNEQWMGYPVGPQYGESSNIDNAHRLRGKLFLIVGEMDNNVPVESTLRFVDALIKAGKDFDFLLVPGAGHGSGGAYGNRRRDDFFVRHLLGTEPPDRNAGARPSGG